MFNVGDTLLKLATESGFAGFFANGGWQNLVMIVIACVLLLGWCIEKSRKRRER